MRPARALWVYLLFVFGGAALVAPWIFLALQKSGASDLHLRRIVDRGLLVLALAALWPLVQGLGIRSPSEIGLRRDVPITRDILRGLLFGTILLAIGAIGSVAAGACQLDSSRTVSAWLRHLRNAAFTAVFVAFIEELLFRGAIYTALRRTWNETSALWGSGAIYGILHFLGRPENPADLHWYSGFIALGSMLRGFTDFHTVFPGFLSITLLGVILALAFRKTGTLYYPMGIHAGVVFGVKNFGYATNRVPGANVQFWGTEKLVDGWFCFLLLLAATIWFSRNLKTSTP